MLDWTDFCTTLDFGTLVPDEFDRYRPAITDGLTFFLSSLSPARTFAILAEQAALPDDTGLDERLVAIARHSPALHKLGQVLARDRRLPLRFRRLLQHLESMQPTQDLAEVRAALEAELGPLSQIGVSLDEPPLAEASVAVVVPFTWQDGDGPDGQRRRGVFKLLKSGVEDRLDEDLQLLQCVGARLDERCHQYGLPEIDYEATFAQVRDLLRLEVHLEKEQEHLTAARAAYAGMDSVVVPQLYPFSTARVTAMERIDGCKVTDAGTLSAAARRDLAALIAEALIAHPLWSPDPSAMFHADPHAGNLLVTGDRKLAILDWSLVGSLKKSDRICLAQLLLGAITLDARQIVRAISGLAEGPVDEPLLRRIVDDRLRCIPQRAWPGPAWVTDLMDDVVTKARVRFGPGLILFRKVLLTLKGVMSDVSEDVSLGLALAKPFLAQFGREWGRRLLAPPFARDFGTHIANADIAQLLLFAPLTTWRYWFRLWAANMSRVLATHPATGGLAGVSLR